jgi:ectoine hydroxylase
MWNDDQLASYREQGFLIQRGLLSAADLAALEADTEQVLHGAADGMHRVQETSGAVRSVFLAHRHAAAYRQLASSPAVAGPVKQILDADAYVWHSKLNVKEALEGAVWLWHQDYGYWTFDGAPAERFVSVMIFLDRATLNNGCMMVVPGSHRWGDLPHYADEVTTNYKQWCIRQDVVRERLRDEDIVPVTGEPGDVLFFGGNTVHGSGHNMSPLSRKVWIIAYNAIDNKPLPVENPRPDWVVSRAFDVVT